MRVETGTTAMPAPTRSRAASSAGRGSREVRLGDGHHPVAHVQQAEHGQVLARLGHRRRRRRPRTAGSRRRRRRPRPCGARSARGRARPPGPAAARRGGRAARSPARSRCPRAFSAARRSVSRPVSARTRAVLPWSMCPAVPSVRGGRLRAHDRARRPASGSGVEVGVGQGEHVEQHAAARDPGGHGGSPRPQRRGQRVGVGPRRSATAKLGSSVSGSVPPPDAPDGRDRPRPPTAARQALGRARGARRPGRGASRQRGDRRAGPARGRGAARASPRARPA